MRLIPNLDLVRDSKGGGNILRRGTYRRLSHGACARLRQRSAFRAR